MILDTNAYSALANGVQSIADAVGSSKNLELPLPVVAELRYGFAKDSRRQQNEETLQRFLAQPQVSILCPSLETTNYYANIQLLCLRKGRALSHNDIWIASLACETNGKLVTYDKDFSILADLLGDNLLVLEV